ncbi:MAG: hypothetical protein KKD18_05050 [Nanoarchaeota archaeon]|nr:hypothetical protein [Nanoarchaeota archaeon]MBU0977758.1 hypothetical protein [Nanoarchaeota archaeon]
MIFSNTEIYHGLFILVVLILSALPLHKAVKIFKGKTTFLKTLFIMTISGLVISTIDLFVAFYSGLIAFVFLIWIYKKSFKLKWHKAIMVWALHLAFVLMSAIVLEYLIKAISGISVFIS